jgi:2,3-dihydroxybenzoate decarboxylase
VNGFTSWDVDNILYYDLRLIGRLARVEALDVPFYHPRNPHRAGQSSTRPQLDARPGWAFAAETASRSARLIGSGLFDEYPRLKIVLGHIGEGIPIYLWRIDNRNGWMKAAHKYPAKHSVAHYFRKHFYLTTSGNFDTPALVNAMSVVGADRVMFSVDWRSTTLGKARNYSTDQK